jgi:hypothetical protein
VAAPTLLLTVAEPSVHSLAVTAAANTGASANAPGDDCVAAAVGTDLILLLNVSLVRGVNPVDAAFTTTAAVVGASVFASPVYSTAVTAPETALVASSSGGILRMVVGSAVVTDAAADATGGAQAYVVVAVFSSWSSYWTSASRRFCCRHGGCWCC